MTRPEQLLEALHRSNFEVSVRDGCLVVEPAERVVPHIRHVIEMDYHALLRAVVAAAELQRVMRTWR